MAVHALYRFWNDDDLLYIGITMNPAGRWQQHAADKPWWSQVTNISIETHPDREAVLAAERRAIVAERPRYNVIHNSRVTVATATTISAPPSGLNVGDVVGVAVGPGICPRVGRIVEVTKKTIQLDLFSWLTGYFGYERVTILRSTIVETSHAKPYSPAHVREEGYTLGAIVWDMEPLAEFQNRWNDAA